MPDSQDDHFGRFPILFQNEDGSIGSAPSPGNAYLVWCAVSMSELRAPSRSI